MYPTRTLIRSARLRAVLLVSAVVALSGCGPSRPGSDASLNDAGPNGPDASADAGTGFDSSVAPDAGSDAGSTACFEPPIPRGLAIHTGGGADFTTAGSWVVLTGMTPTDIGGQPVEGVTVNGVSRSVSFDAGSGAWSYFGPLSPGPNSFDVRATAGAATDGPLSITVTSSAAPPAEVRPGFGPGVHLVGSWFFSWFTGDPSWECSSPWWPVSGFAAWDGSVAWARDQLRDQMDANLDFIGLQLDTKDPTLPWGVRWTNVANIIVAYGELLEEGYRPPAMALFLDTAIVNQLHLQATGSDLDVSTPAGRAEFYDYVNVFYSEATAVLGPRFVDAALAVYQGRPMVALWHTDTGSIVGADEAFVLDLKARFLADWGVEPYLVAHPNFWSSWPSVDEITLMFGPPTHFFSGGRDGAGNQTVNITAGFWNPTTNPFYLARLGGVSFDTAWASALGSRATADHLYIDSWNETGEGSGIFEAQVFSHGAGYTGACGTWVYPHADDWGPTPRHYIDTTATNAAMWNDVPVEDAAVIATDLPASLAPGERRLATVVMRNTGDRAWTAAASDAVITTSGAALVPAGAALLDDTRDEIPRYGGIFRGRPRAFTVELVGPCEAGAYPLELRVRRGDGTGFGETASTVVTVP